MTTNDCPRCFASDDCGKLDACNGCEFSESCRYCYENDSESANRRLGHVSYDRMAYSRQVADPGHHHKIKPVNDSDVKAVLEYLLDLDNYSAELLHEVLHGGCNSASDLARKLGVSRQAIHRKIVDCCHLHPELRKLFVSRLHRCRRILRDSKRLSGQKEKTTNQMEFQF